MKTLVACLIGCVCIGSFLPSDLQAQTDGPLGAPFAIAEGSQLHTDQVFGTDPSVLLDQFDAAIKRLSGRIVKLHIVAVDNPTVEAAVAEVKNRYASTLPAITCMVGKLSSSEAKLGMDAVIVFRQATPVTKRVVEDQFGRILHPGPRFYVSGQAEKGLGDFGEVEGTMRGMQAAISWQEGTLDDIVQIKAFITPVRSEKRVRAEIQKFLGKRRIPIVIVEWQSTLPIEIEMVAASASGSKSDSIEYLPLPALPNSPLYARLTRMNSEQTIYIGGLYARGHEALSAEAEVKDVFAALREVLKTTGSDLENLVKATYYCSSNDTGNQLNTLRPNYYNPARPPAASKANVTGVGRDQRFITMDMIAAPR